MMIRLDTFSWKAVIFAVISLGVLISSYGIINGVSSTPFLYEEKSDYLFALNILDTGDIVYRNEYTDLNRYFDYPIAALTNSVWEYNTNASVTNRFVGNIYLIAYSITLFGKEYFQLVYVILFIFSSIFLALSVIEFAKYIKSFCGEPMPSQNTKKKIVIVSSLVYMLFSPFVLWSNTYYDTISSSFFFISAIYLLIKYVNSNRLIYISLAAMFLGLTTLMRFDYIIFVSSIMLATCLMNLQKERPKINKICDIVCVCSIFALMLLILASINNYLYGSPFKIGYMLKNHMVNIFNVDKLLECSTQNIGLLDKIINVYFYTFIHPDLDIISYNIYNFLIVPFWIYLLMLILCLLCLIPVLRHLQLTYFVLILGPVLFWCYYIFTGTFWGMQHPTWIVNCYYRYSIPIFIYILILCSIFLTVYLRKIIIKRSQYKLSILLVIGIFMLNNLDMIFLSDYGVDEVIREKEINLKLNQDLDVLTEDDALIWAPFYEKAILCRYTLSPWYIAEDGENRIKKILDYTYELLQLSHSVYYVSSEWHKSTYLELDNAFEKDPRFKLDPIKQESNYVIYSINISEASYCL